MLTPTMPPARARAASRASTTGAPSLLKPRRLITARSASRRKIRGRGLPACARGVTVPTSTKPKPRRSSASGTTAFLSKPGATPTGLGKFSPNARTAISGGSAAARATGISRNALSVSAWASSGSRARSSGRDRRSNRPITDGRSGREWVRTLSGEPGPIQGSRPYNPLASFCSEVIFPTDESCPTEGRVPARRHAMLTHAQIWNALDRLAARNKLTASGLAKKAGLDPTTFNKSKRITPEGRQRWPSTESVAKALAATNTKVETFVGLITDGAKPVISTVPMIGFAQAGEGGHFDDSGFPVGK